MALRKIPHPEEAATGPRGARPEDRLRSCLEGRKVLIQLIVNFFTASFAGNARSGLPH
jgi:hypothetical protein